MNFACQIFYHHSCGRFRAGGCFGIGLWNGLGRCWGWVRRGGLAVGRALIGRRAFRWVGAFRGPASSLLLFVTSLFRLAFIQLFIAFFAQARLIFRQVFIPRFSLI